MTTPEADLTSRPGTSRSLPRTAPPSSAGSSRRRPSITQRLTVNVVAAFLAAMFAFVAIAVVLRDRRDMVIVAVAADRVPAGTVIEPGMVRPVEVPASVEFTNALVAMDKVSADGLVAARTIQPGEAIPLSAIGNPDTASGARVMAIRVASWQAAGGDIEVGDLLDVIDTRDDATRYVLTAAAVVGRSTPNGTGGFSAGSRNDELVLTVEVTDAEALDLAGVVQSGKLVIVRSTGAPPASAPASAATPGAAESTVPVSEVVAG